MLHGQAIPSGLREVFKRAVCSAFVAIGAGQSKVEGFGGLHRAALLDISLECRKDPEGSFPATPLMAGYTF